MSRLAPTWALSAQAIDAAGDAHLQPGAHLRVLPSVALGLPVAPLIVGRAVLSPREISEAHVVWTDASGRRLFPNFDLRDTGPVTAWLPSEPDNPVVWAELTGEAGDRDARLDALVSGLLGPTVVASTTLRPWQVCATGMDRLHVSGEAFVTGVRVVRARSVDPSDVERWRLLALPVERAFRYRGLEDARAQAEDRVLRGAAQLAGLHDEPSADRPAFCSPVARSDELDRVGFLWDERLAAMTDLLLEDASAPPQRLRMPPEPFSGTSTNATLQVPPLATLLQAALDPGVGRLVGLVEHDEAPPGDRGDVVLYIVRGGWSLQRAPFGRRFAWLGSGAPDDPAAFPLDLPDSVLKAREGRFADLWTVAALVLGAETLAPQPPVAGAAEDLGWVPDVPPAARRHVALPLSGLAPAAGVALARESPRLAGLNPRLPELFGGGPDRAVPIVCGILGETGPAPAATAPGQGEVYDRGAPAEAAGYRVAQSDWFGRWSEWTSASVSDGVRPAVPAPVLEAVFVPPATPGDAGVLEVRCVQPRDDELAPGALPLASLDVSAQVGGGTVTAGASAQRGSVPAGTEPQPLVVSISVPPLQPAEKRWLVASARWVDTDGRESAVSPPTRAQAADPRAPAALVLPNTLAYGSRPDALGRSRVRLEWDAAPAPTAYRVYHCDETTLRQRLAGLAGADAAAARAQLDAAPTAPDRAAVFRAHAGLFERSCFELLTASPLPSSGGRMTYEHELSGSLAVLAFYRVVPVSELGAEAAFTGCTLLPRGVPNTPPPPAPLLSAASDPADPGRVVLTVAVPAGATPPVGVRLRRSRVSGADPLAMPVVAAATPGSWPATLLDAGAMPWDTGLRLVPWSTYTWRAEVQGPPEPGSALPGAWSAPSAPVSLRVLPPPPAGVTPGTVASTAAGVEVTFTAGESLDAGPEGAYTIDVYRQVPPQAPPAAAKSGAVGTFAAGAIRQPDGSYLVRDSAAVPPGTAYFVEVADPLGRRGPRVQVGTL